MIKKRIKQNKKNKNAIPQSIRRVVDNDIVFSRNFRSMGLPMRKLIVDSQTINSVAGSPNLQFSTYSTMYYNISNIAGLVDFSQLVGDYEAFRVHSVTIQVRRSVPETSMTSVYSTYLQPIYLAYYPTKVSHNPGSTAIVARESAFIIDPMLITSQVATFKIPNISASVQSGGNWFTYVTTAAIPTSAAGGYPGCFVLGSSNGTAATISTSLYSIRVLLDVEFLFPY